MVTYLLPLAAEGGQIQEIARTFGVDWQHLAAQTISFAIVCALLYRFAYRPVLAMLDARRKTIADGLANAQKIRAELAKIEAQRQQTLRDASERGNKLIEEARQAAAQVREQETQKAIAAAERILADARQAADRDHDRMLAELKREVGHLVVQATAAVSGKVLTQEDQRVLAEETAKQVAA
jgi:F-type H+-transporting ATPase subunit b